LADAPEAPSRAAFDPGMKPSSTVTYEARGARIANVRVVDAADRRVNVLEPGGSYAYAFDVSFDEAATGVRFGMMLKLVTGFELGGQVSSAPGSGIPFVDRGTTVRVRFRFRALLAPGAYFANAGVLALDEDDEIFLHRVLDAVMFRVDARPSDAVTGRVDLSDGAPEIRVITKPANEKTPATRRTGS
jgi:lipopolysaccharide transport system ATP-binding protein